MLDLISLAGAWRQMTDRDGDGELVREVLQLALPQSDADCVAAAAIGRDEEARRVAVSLAPHCFPPTADGVDGEARSIAIDSDAHPPTIVADVVDPVGRRPAKLRNDERRARGPARACPGAGIHARHS